MASAKMYMTVMEVFVMVEDGGIVKGIQLFQTDGEDVEMVRDFGFPRCREGRGNIRILLT